MVINSLIFQNQTDLLFAKFSLLLKSMNISYLYNILYIQKKMRPSACPKKERYPPVHDDPNCRIRQEIMKKTAERLASEPLDSPHKLVMLRCVPDLFVQYMVTVWKINQYMERFQNEIEQDQLQLVRLINLYRVKVNCPGDFDEDEKKIALNHLHWFFVHVHPNSAVLVNNFLRLFLAMTKRGYLIWQDFPDYIFQFGHVDTYVFFNCMNEILCKHQQYNIGPVKNSLVQGLKEALKRFNLEFQGKQTDIQVFAVQNLIFDIIYKFKQCDSFKGPIPTFLFQNLVINQSFNRQLLTFMKKFNRQFLFMIWCEMLIHCDAYHTALNQVESVLFYYLNSAVKFRINELIGRNVEWANYWITEYSKNGFDKAQRVFLTGEPYTFILFNELIQYFNFDSIKHFYETMSYINYEVYVKKLRNDQIVRNSIEILFKKMDNDCQEILDELLEGDL